MAATLDDMLRWIRDNTSEIRYAGLSREVTRASLDIEAAWSDHVRIPGNFAAYRKDIGDHGTWTHAHSRMAVVLIGSPLVVQSTEYPVPVCSKCHVVCDGVDGADDVETHLSAHN